jgi:hypothetical protein
MGHLKIQARRSAVLLILPVLFCLSFAQAQTTSSAQTEPSVPDKKTSRQILLKNSVDSQEYIFRAQTALPMGGGSRQLTSDYDLKISKGSIVSYLPYYGRAYTAPMDLKGGGIEFTSKDFSYTVAPGKKGGWEIQVKPGDVRDVQQLSLRISENGYASLSVISTSRQPISFNGIVTPLKKASSK